MKFNVIVADPPWGDFKDKLTMSKTKRGAESQYSGTLKLEEIKNLKTQMEKLIAKDAVLALWVPSSMLQDGLDVMQAWGFKQKQTWIWVKTKKSPLQSLTVEIKNTYFNRGIDNQINSVHFSSLKEMILNFNLNDVLNFKMGRLFRATHEICLIGTKGKIYNRLKNRSQRSVYLWPVDKHSDKPEGLQDMLDIMFPGKRNKKLELFARRQRSGYVCLGNEAPETYGQDIRDSLDDLIKGKIK